MAKCLYCGRSGLFLKVTKNKLCSDCELFVVRDIENRGRIINDSLEIVNNSHNVNTVLSRYEVLISQTNDLMSIYEDKGITTSEPKPSKFLAKLLDNRDETIVEACEREFDDTIVKNSELKTAKGKLNRFKKLSDKMSLASNEVTDPALLDPIQTRIQYWIEDLDG